jgi:hypothetical protein
VWVHLRLMTKHISLDDMMRLVLIVNHPGLFLIARRRTRIRTKRLQVHPHLLGGAERGHGLEDGDELFDAEGLDQLRDAPLEEHLVDDRQVFERALK